MTTNQANIDRAVVALHDALLLGDRDDKNDAIRDALQWLYKEKERLPTASYQSQGNKP